MDTSVVDELYTLSDCVLFSGGADVNPELYGQKKHEKTETIDTQRDELELHIIKKTLTDSKPFLGICRGAHILAVACKGTLHQHLPDITEEQHAPQDIDITLAENFQLPEHPVIITPYTKAYAVFNSQEIMVPSGHHQAVNNPGDLVVSGHSPAGITEIIEHPELPFHIGIQGHPESSESLDAVFKAFYDAA
jgi:putative glutamine amidotransferase